MNTRGYVRRGKSLGVGGTYVVPVRICVEGNCSGVVVRIIVG